MNQLERPSRATFAAVVAVMLASLPGCAVVGDIFKAGLWVGIIAVVFVVAIVAGIASLIRRGG